MSARINTAQALVRRLEQHGVGTVFGIPGTHNLEIYRALGESGIRHVTPRHEQGGGYAADGFARSTGGAGVCITTSGPGLTNAATAAATADSDSVAVLIVSPGMPDSIRGKGTGHLHQLRDERGLMEALVERQDRVATPAEAIAAVDRFFGDTATRRPRPVHIEIPLDAMSAEAEAEELPLPEEPAPAAPDPAAIAAARELLLEARSPLLILGGGAAGAPEEALRLAESLGAPVLTTVNGKGTIPEQHPLSLGASLRVEAAHNLLRNADVVLAVGTELSESDLWRLPFDLDGRLIRVDIDPEQLDKNFRAEVGLLAGAGEAMQMLADGPEPSGRADRGEEIARLRALISEQARPAAAPYATLMETLAAVLPAGAVIAGDSTMACYYGVVHALKLDAPRRFLYPTGFATLGYGIPAAIGAKLARPEAPVLALLGDGGLMFTAAEIATAAELGMPLPIIVLNNEGYGEIRREMRERGISTEGASPRAPDLPALARSLGAEGVRSAGAEEADLGPLLERALSAAGPTLIEIPVSDH